MKKMLCILVLLCTIGLICGEQTRTATMDSLLISNLRSAVTNGSANYDEVMDFYYDEINPGSSDFGGDEDEILESRADYEPINKASIYATQSLLGVIDEELEYTGQDTIYLNYAKRYLLDSNFPILVP